MSAAADYEAFIAAKQLAAPEFGLETSAEEISRVLFPFQRDIVRWAVKRGRAAIFASFGLGKTLVDLEIQRIILAREGGRGLIVVPLGVRQEFVRDAKLLGLDVKFVRRIEECGETGIFLTNYETVRDGKLDPRLFTVVSLDEAAILRGLGGSKTFREFMRVLENGQVKYKFVFTATPSPNEYVELLAYSVFLDVIEVGNAKTRFFKRDSTKADTLTIHPHKVREFWLWMASWALFVTKPSDIDPSYSDDGYTLPPLNVHWHELATDHANAGSERDGQMRMIKDSAIGIVEASREKRDSLDVRLAKVMEIVRAGSGEQSIVWCELNDEQRAIEKALAADGITVSSLIGTTDVDTREVLLEQWRDRETSVFLSKCSMYGAGCNLQQSHTMVFAGIGFKAVELLQGIHRIHRFGQTSACDVHLVYTDAEREVRRTLEKKWIQHNELVEKMTSIVREFGLARSAMQEELGRSKTLARAEARGESFTLANNDCVVELRAMPSDSVHHIITSIPFSMQYEYTPSYHDFGHTDTNEHFFAQMDFLVPELLRVLKPGRIAAIHVKDRIVPGGLTGMGFQTVYPFHCDTIAHFTRHGFAFLGMKTIVTDVVRENNSTYRLGWTEQCKDGSRMGAGMPEYLLIFRKPPTDATSGYADDRVVKSKDSYTRGRWQLDAHGFMRSSGNRLLCAEDLVGIAHEKMFKRYREHSMSEVYDFEHHVQLCEAIDARGMLPVTFMLLQPASWHPDVWTDITRMRTLNGAQVAANRMPHICPLQFDIVDRAIVQYSQSGETILDPFAGIGTVPYCALKLGRRGVGVELNPGYYADAVTYCRGAEREISAPTLFDIDAVGT